MQLSFRGVKFDEIKKKICIWTWQEIRYGYKQSFIEEEEVIEFAKDSLGEDMPDFDTVIELAIKTSNESIENELQFLCDNEKNESEEAIKSKWLFAILNCLFDKKTQINNIQEVIDSIYADFEYPEEMADFVSYMPYYGDGGDDIEKRWEKYLAQGKKKYCKNT